MKEDEGSGHYHNLSPLSSPISASVMVLILFIVQTEANVGIKRSVCLLEIQARNISSTKPFYEWNPDLIQTVTKFPFISLGYDVHLMTVFIIGTLLGIKQNICRHIIQLVFKITPLHMDISSANYTWQCWIQKLLSKFTAVYNFWQGSVTEEIALAHLSFYGESKGSFHKDKMHLLLTREKQRDHWWELLDTVH